MTGPLVPCLIVDDNLDNIIAYTNFIKHKITDEFEILPFWLPQPESYSAQKQQAAEEEIAVKIHYNEVYWDDREAFLNCLQSQMENKEFGLVLMDNKLETAYDEADGWKLAKDLKVIFPNCTALVVTNFPTDVSILKKPLNQAQKDGLITVVAKEDNDKLHQLIKRHLEKFQTELEELDRDQRSFLDSTLAGRGTHDQGQSAIMYLTALLQDNPLEDRHRKQDCLEVLNDYLGHDDEKGAVQRLEEMTFHAQENDQQTIENIKEIGALFAKNKTLLSSVKSLRAYLQDSSLNVQDSETFISHIRNTKAFIENFIKMRDISRFFLQEDWESFCQHNQITQIENTYTTTLPFIVESKKKATIDALEILIHDSTKVMTKQYQVLPSCIRLVIDHQEELPDHILQSNDPTRGGDTREALNLLFKQGIRLTAETASGVFSFPESTGLERFEEIDVFDLKAIKQEPRDNGTQWVIQIPITFPDIENLSHAVNKKVLYLEDTPSPLLIRFLQDKGFYVELCTSFKQALEVLESHSYCFDAVITDLKLEKDSKIELEGLELVRNISQRNSLLKACAVQSALPVDEYKNKLPSLEFPLALFCKPYIEQHLADWLEYSLFNEYEKNEVPLYKKVHTFIGLLITLRTYMDLIYHKIPIKEDAKELSHNLIRLEDDIRSLTHEFLYQLEQDEAGHKTKEIRTQLQQLINDDVNQGLVQTIKEQVGIYKGCAKKQRSKANDPIFMQCYREYKEVLETISNDLRTRFV